MAGPKALRTRASRRACQRSAEHLISAYAAALLHELDRAPLWRGNHVAVKQLVEDFPSYLYLPRLKDPAVLRAAIR